jgi:hypothetical protein
MLRAPDENFEDENEDEDEDEQDCISVWDTD